MQRPTMFRSALSEDIEMMEDFTAVDQWADDYTASDPTVYLVVDTNVLMGHLSTVKRLCKVLRSYDHPPLVLIIPFTVINELDKLTASTHPAGSTPNGDVTVGDLARMATTWLLDLLKTRPKGQEGEWYLKCQKWGEQLDKQLTKPDDKILDCCLYFRANPPSSSVRVLLWTNDRNLALLAETNEVSTVTGQHLSVQHVLRKCKVSISDALLDEIHEAETNGQGHTVLDEDADMELDEDLLNIRHDPSSSKASSLITPTSPSNFESIDRSTFDSNALLFDLLGGSSSLGSPPSTPFIPTPRTSPSKPSSYIPQTPSRPPSTQLSPAIPIIKPLVLVLQRLIDRRTPNDPFEDWPNTPLEDIHDLHHAFLAVESNKEACQFLHAQSTGPVEDVQRSLLRCLDATRTLKLYLPPPTKTKARTSSTTVRPGQAADALVVLSQKLSLLQLITGVQAKQLEQVAIDIRRD